MEEERAIKNIGINVVGRTGMVVPFARYVISCPAIYWSVTDVDSCFSPRILVKAYHRLITTSAYRYTFAFSKTKSLRNDVQKMVPSWFGFSRVLGYFSPLTLTCRSYAFVPTRRASLS